MCIKTLMHIFFTIHLWLFSTNTKAFVSGGILINASSSVPTLLDGIDFTQITFYTAVFTGKCILGGILNLGIKRFLDLSFKKKKADEN